MDEKWCLKGPKNGLMRSEDANFRFFLEFFVLSWNMLLGTMKTCKKAALKKLFS